MAPKIWEKILTSQEKIEFEFKLGKNYLDMVRLFFIFNAFLSLIIFSIFCFKTKNFVGNIFSYILFFVGNFSFFLSFFVPWYLKKSNNFALTNQRILILRGWLSNQLISVDYDKITDIKVEQNFFEKIFLNTGSVIINTAGSPFPEIVLVNVENPFEIKRKIEEIKKSR